MVTSLYELFVELWSSLSANLGGLFDLVFRDSLVDILQAGVDQLPQLGAFDNLAQFVVDLLGTMLPETTLFAFVCGSGLIFFLAYTIIKWFADIVL